VNATRRRPSRPAPRRRAGALLLLGLLSCRTAATSGTTSPAGGTHGERAEVRPEGREESSTVGDLKARLQRLSAQHHALASGGSSEFGVCEELCDLAAKICSVKESLCELADRHTGEQSYQQLCREAQHECRDANDGCVACAEKNGS
jgi:hypothetical protein